MGATAFAAGDVLGGFGAGLEKDARKYVELLAEFLTPHCGNGVEAGQGFEGAPGGVHGESVVSNQ